MNPIYLDHNATAPLAPEVLEAMSPYLREAFGNASSAHVWGRQARGAIDCARGQVAALIHAEPDEIVFASGGTESNNLALRGAFFAVSEPRLCVSAVEHHAVLEPARALAGDALEFLPVDAEGRVDLGEAAARLEDKPGSVLVSVMLANNDVGALQPVGEMAPLVKRQHGLLHVDAAQAAGRILIDVRALGADYLSLSAHKLHGPKGVGALYIRRGAPFVATSYGGRQEAGRRPGTENVAGIVGFGAACALAMERLAADAAVMRAARDAFEAQVLGQTPQARVNAAGAERLPNTSNIRFEGLDAHLFVMALDLEGVAASVGSACVSESREPSHVLLAMGLTPEAARGSLRFSFGRGQTVADAERAAEVVIRVAQRLYGGAT